MNNLQDYSLEELKKIITNLGFPAFRAKQIFDAMLNGKDYADKINISKELIEKLQENNYALQAVKIIKKVVAKDKTTKYLFKLFDGNVVEGVLMQYKFGKTLCLSTQVGCKMNCAFCASGLNGWKRNLTAGEILSQVVAVNTDINGTLKNREITNIVLMGTGEPLDNFDNVVKFLKLVTSEEGFNISVRNISISTCGIPSKIEKLADLGLACNLCISLHAPNDEIRKTIMPIAKSYSIASVLESANYYSTITNRRFYVEYVLIKNVNSAQKHAEELASILQELPCHVNLIKLNDVPERGLIGATDAQTNTFLNTLLRNKISATIRRKMGDDVTGACGQLRNSYIEK